MKNYGIIYAIGMARNFFRNFFLEFIKIVEIVDMFHANDEKRYFNYSHSNLIYSNQLN